jgi:hypothetical protein
MQGIISVDDFSGATLLVTRGEEPGLFGVGGQLTGTAFFVAKPDEEGAELLVRLGDEGVEVVEGFLS